MANMMMNTKTYAQITGIALAAVAVLGIVLSLVGDGGQFGLFCSSPSATTCEGDAAMDSFLGFDWTHNIVHVVLAAIALYVGFGNVAGNYRTLYARIFGIVYTGLAVAGFFSGVVDGLNTALALHLELGENLVHLVIGVWGLAVGFMAATTGTTTTTTTPTRRV